jgi:hypothetical protein
MATRVQKAHSTLLLRALAGRALKKLSGPYEDLKTSLDGLQFEVQDHEQTAVASALRFLKTVDGIITSTEKISMKEFPFSYFPKEKETGKLGKKQFIKKASKAIRDISAWATNAHKTIGALDQSLSNDILALRNEAGMQSLAFDDSFLPESVSEEKETELIEEYRKLARIWRKIAKR